MMTSRRALLLAILACAVSFASGRAAEPPRVRVLTYNIQHGAGTDGQSDLARTAAVIKRLTPDLVALQEVDKTTTRSHGVDLPTHSPLVTRWLKALVRYDTRGARIVHVTITIRGHVRE